MEYAELMLFLNYENFITSKENMVYLTLYDNAIKTEKVTLRILLTRKVNNHL